MLFLLRNYKLLSLAIRIYLFLYGRILIRLDFVQQFMMEQSGQLGTGSAQKEHQLKGAPKYGNDNTWNWADPATARTVNDYYGVAI